jgi:hypothetical protein
MTNVTFTRRDASREDAITSFRVTQILADGSNYAALNTALSTLGATIEDIVNGNLIKEELYARQNRYTNATPTDDSRREQKWRVVYEDTSTLEVYDYTIPCSDWTNCNRAADSDWWDMNNLSTEQSAFVAAFEAVVLSPRGNATNIIGVEDVGRNN